MDEVSLAHNARNLETVLKNFGVRGEIMEVRPGPIVTLYELEPAPGLKSSRVINLAEDIARSMRALTVRIAVVPGRSVIGIELPNPTREKVFLREMLDSDSYQQTPAKLALVLGKDIGGAPIIVDLARMPHLLIAGDRFRQVGLHQYHDPVAALPAAAGEVPLHHGRSQDAGTVRSMTASRTCWPRW